MQCEMAHQKTVGVSAKLTLHTAQKLHIEECYLLCYKQIHFLTIYPVIACKV